MNLLQIVQQAVNELGSTLSQPTAVVASTDPAIRQMYALVNRFGRDLARQFRWERLDKEHLITTQALNTTGDTTADSAVVTNIPSTAQFTTNWGIAGGSIPPFSNVLSVDSATQVTLTQPATRTEVGVVLNAAQVAYPLPSDWLMQIPQTEWDRTNRWPLNGPKSPQEWQNFKSGIVYAGPRLRFRIQNRAVQINPPPSASGTLAFEYISQNWVESAAGAGQASYLDDTDTAVFDDSLMVAGLKVKWLQAKGLESTYAEVEFRQLLDTIKGQDQSAPTLSLSPVYTGILLSNANIPDGSWSTI